MPELPDIEVIKDYLATHVAGQRIESADHIGAIVVRNLLPGDAQSVRVGRVLTDAGRRGKFLLLALDDGTQIVINFMLTGRLHYCAPATRVGTRTYLVLGLSGGMQLRYIDATQMGKIYLTDDTAKIPTFAEQGPEALDPVVTLDVFRERLRRHPGEIKGILTNQTFLAGIGNAYADEILFRAGIYPFRKRPQIAAEETARLYEAMRTVLNEATATIRARLGDNIHEEIRDFLLVHGRTNQPCPRCGAPISLVSANQRITNFCRACQPGTLIRQT
jgi:formamidopyrimidine-DNA glycosylase